MKKIKNDLLRGQYFLMLGLYTFLLSLNFFDFLPPQDLVPGSDHPARVIFDYKFEIFSELFLLSCLWFLVGFVLIIGRYLYSKKRR
jgi:hypothetical protein